jgi:hypothetical protein
MASRHPAQTHWASSIPRVLAILLLILFIALALFGKVFRFGQNCGRTIGGTAGFGELSESRNFNWRIAATPGSPAGQRFGLKAG